MLKRAQVILCSKHIGKLASDFSTFIDFLEKLHYKIWAERPISARKILKMIENLSYSIRYCKISLLTYSGSSIVSNTGLFVAHPVQI